MFDKMFESPNSLLSSRNRYQFLTTLIINIIAVSHGIGVGWVSPTLRILQTEETPLSFPISTSELSWIGSCLGIGSVLGNILLGLLLDRIGSKKCLLFLALPQSCLWLLVYFAPSVEYLFVGRILAGTTGGGMYIVHSIFISEIADAQIRGTLSSMVLLSVNVGVLAGYIIGTYVSYYMIPWLVLMGPLGYFICGLFLPESPHHLIRKGKYAAAEEAFRYYKNIKDTDSLNKQERSLHEFEELKLALSKRDWSQEQKLCLKDFLTKPALKASGLAFALLIANQFSGLFAFVNYMSDIFAQSGSTMDPNTCSIIIGVVQIGGTYVTTLLCDIYGRKILMLVSAAGVVISLTAFGLFTHYAQIYDLSHLSWVPLVLMSLDIFLGNIGLVGCFFVLMVEVFPAKIRATAAKIGIIISSCFVFLVLKIFPLCMDYFGISITMLALAAITAVCFVIFLFFLKETKGKSMLVD